MNWDYISLDDAPLEILDGDRGKNYPKQGEFFSQEHCLFLSATNVTKTGFEFQECQFITEQKDEILRKGKLKRNDIVVTTRGTIGNVAHYNNNVSYDHVRINSGMVIIRTDENDLYAPFLYAYFRSSNFFKQVNQLRSGVAQPQLPIRDMKLIEIPFPKVDEQKRIADLINKYDSLIENNRRRIQLLEESARLLYKEWFVHLRFPGHEHVKITDGVPEGWALSKLVEFADLTMGQSPKSEFYNQVGEGLPFHQGVTNYGFRFVSHKTYCTKITRLAEPGDILCSVRAPVGRLNITLDKMILGRGLAAIRAKSGHQSFLFYSLRTFFFKEDIMGSGAIYASVTKKDMEGVELLIPSSMILQEFENQASEIDRQIINLSKQNYQLAQARDILLPV